MFLPFRPDDIREQTMWFLSEHAKTKMAALCGISFSQKFRDTLPTLSFQHREDSRQPSTWQEYCTLMADINTYPDSLFAMAAATAYQCQIIMFNEDGTSSAFTPDYAFRRIHLFVSDDFQHFNWGASLSEQARQELVEAGASDV